MTKTPVKIGKFRIIDAIGKGSMGTVYRAYDPFMQRHVAIKVTYPKSLSDNSIRRRLVEFFFNEAKIYGMLRHRNILPVYDAGEDGDRYYLVMEYIENSRTLLSYCHPDNLLPVPKVVELLHQCCKGLQYAHSRNVIHLDIKPSNIMLTPDDWVRLADFGLAKVLHHGTDSLALENIFGTPSHLSPERLRKGPVDHRADIYSLGVVMFSLLTGHRPFSAPELKDLLAQVRNDDPPALRRFRPELPDLLEPIVKKALNKDVNDRYPSAAEMAVDLNAFHEKIVHAFVTADIGLREKLDRLKELPFFKDFFETELSEVVNAADWLEYEAGRTILTEGDLDESFYVVIEGEVSVVSGGAVIAALTSGDCFGEMAYGSRRPRSVRIQAASDVTVMKLNQRVIEQTSVYCQLKFSKTFLNTLIARLSKDH